MLKPSEELGPDDESPFGAEELEVPPPLVKEGDDDEEFVAGKEHRFKKTSIKA